MTLDVASEAGSWGWWIAGTGSSKWLWPVLGMSLRKVTSLGSNFVSVTDLKRILTRHSLCCDSGGYKTFTTSWSGGRVQVWVQFWARASHLAISLKAVPEAIRRFRGQNQLPSSWGSSPALLALVGQASTNTGRFRVGCSLEILTQFKSQQGSNALWIRAATSHFFSHVKWKFRWNQQKVVVDQSSCHRLAQSFCHKNMT